MAAMLRRLFAFIAVLSAMIFLAVAACGGGDLGGLSLAHGGSLSL